MSKKYIPTRISELIQEWPEVDLTKEKREVLEEIAYRWLKGEYQKRYRFSVRLVENKTRNPESVRIQRDTAIDNAVARITRETAEKTFANWPTAMLNLEYDIDGVRVRFGSMTLAQHQKRRTEMERKASTMLESASLHAKAEGALLESGANTLDEMVKVAA